jgi:hypothetical protein
MFVYDSLEKVPAMLKCISLGFQSLDVVRGVLDLHRLNPSPSLLVQIGDSFISRY